LGVRQGPIWPYSCRAEEISHWYPAGTIANHFIGGAPAHILSAIHVGKVIALVNKMAPGSPFLTGSLSQKDIPEVGLQVPLALIECIINVCDHKS
jgi:hypothetical protein